MKTEFELLQYQKQQDGSYKLLPAIGAPKVMIKPSRGRWKQLAPSVVIRDIFSGELELKEVDLERFAVNILKALKSKRLK